MKAQRRLSALAGEERIMILRHIGTKPLPDDQYSRLTSVIDDWNLEESILNHPDVDDKPSYFRSSTNKHCLFANTTMNYTRLSQLPATVVRSV